LAYVQQARRFIRQVGVCEGRRCALIAPNSIHRVAFDLAIIAEGGVVVPLYDRMAPQDQVAIMQDCDPVLIACGDSEIQRDIHENWPGAPPTCVLSEAFEEVSTSEVRFDPPTIPNDRVVAIIYTSGTSGQCKGVMLTCGNLNFMLDRTIARFDRLLADVKGRQRFFHYLPFCFAGSWILLLASLVRGNELYLSTDLQNVRSELSQAKPHFFMNVPTFLERVKRGVEGALCERGGFALKLFDRAKLAWSHRIDGRKTLSDRCWLRLANRVIFKAVRAGLSPNLQAIVCGSAPLTEDTQRFFNMMGVTVLQVYGLTETTAICTMDVEHDIQPGWVGHAIDGVEMRLGENDEIQVRGPNVFKGYWNRPDETAECFDGEWFKTGDQGEVSQAGNWRIVGRLKDLLILNSGHNIAPEALEAKLSEALPEAEHLVLVGNNRSFLSLIVSGPVTEDAVSEALERFNEDQSTYKRIHAFCICDDAIDWTDGLVTANGKLRRSAIATRFEAEIQNMYRARTPQCQT